jgi:hypothetical protein
MQIRTISAVFLSAATIVAGTASRADASPMSLGSTSYQSFVDTSFAGSVNDGQGGDSWYSDFVFDQFTSSGVWASGGAVLDGLHVDWIDGLSGDSWYSDFVLNHFTLPPVANPWKKEGRFFGVLGGGQISDPPQDGAVPTPEPGTLLLVATGIAGAGARRYRSKKEAR